MNASYESFERIGVPTCVVNQHGRIVSWNHSAAEFFHRPAAEALGSDWHTVVKTVETSGCCALCRTRQAMDNGEVTRPVEVTLSIYTHHEPAVVVPVPLPTALDGTLGFLILRREPAPAPAPIAPEPIPFQPRVRQLDGDRIIESLSPREREILRCVVDGLDARSIAARVGVTHATARNYVQRILTKLGVRNKAEAVNVALSYHLLAS